MARINDGGPAFPTYSDQEYERPDGSVHALDIDTRGMSLRDWFAGMALGAFMRSTGHEGTAALCYQMADAMLVARNFPSTEE